MDGGVAMRLFAVFGLCVLLTLSPAARGQTAPPPPPAGDNDPKGPSSSDLTAAGLLAIPAVGLTLAILAGIHDKKKTPVSP
jgi:hypothetical protein